MWSVPVFQRVEESQAQDGQKGEDRKAAAGQGLLGRQGDWIQVQAAAINEKFFAIGAIIISCIIFGYILNQIGTIFA